MANSHFDYDRRLGKSSGSNDAPLWQDHDKTITFFNEACKGWKLDALPAQNLTSLGETTVCGRRGQANFLETIRVNPSKGQTCPGELYSCINRQNVAETACVSDLNQCPILDMKLVKGNKDTLYEGYTTLGNFAADEQGNNLNLIFSKTHSSKGDFQPIVGTEPLTNLEKPCFGFDSESLMMDEAQSKNVFLPIESEDTQAECETQFNWRHHDNPDEKTRYSESLLSVDFYKL